MILRNADRVIAACSYAEKGLKGDYGLDASKVAKITPGVDYQKFDPSANDHALLRRLNLEGKKIILTIGRLIERKGQDTVIRAMPEILRSVPEAVYLIGGRGHYEPALKNLVEDMGLGEHVRFLGFVPAEDVALLYSICYVFVMINRDSQTEGPEGFGMVFTEASAAGKPVIGGRSGGTEDSIIDGVTGFRVDPNSVDAVADHVIRILKDDDLRTTLGKNGRDWVERTFDWREKAKQLELVNKSILGL
jgi:phosphatidylinositol alpha-1,6-mannosyltransferase